MLIKIETERKWIIIAGGAVTVEQVDTRVQSEDRAIQAEDDSADQLNSYKRVTYSKQIINNLTTNRHVKAPGLNNKVKLEAIPAAEVTEIKITSIIFINKRTNFKGSTRADSARLSSTTRNC